MLECFKYFLFVLMLVSCGKETYFDGVGIPIRETNRGDYGLVGLDGKILVDFELDAKPKIMTENWTHYTYDKKLVFVNDKGKETTTDLLDALSFHEGTILCKLNNGKLAFYDKTLQMVIILDDVEEAGPISSGLFKFSNAAGDWGFMNLKGDVVVKPVYHKVKSFREGFSIVEKYDEESKTNRVGIIDNKGEYVVQLSTKFTELDSFSEGLSAFKSDDQSGYIDINGNKVIVSDSWRETFPFFKGLASVKGDDGEYGLIDEKGSYLIKTREKIPVKLFNGLSIYQGSNRKLGFMSSERELTTRSEFEDMMPFLNNGAFAKDGGEWMYIDENGKDISEFNKSIRLIYHEPFTKSVYKDNTPFDLNSTLKSSFINIDGFYKEIMKESSGVMHKIMTARKNLDASYLENLMLEYDKEISLIDKVGVGKKTIDTYQLMNGYFEFDSNISFSLKYYFNERVISKNGDGKFFNEDSKVSSIRVKIKPQRKGKGKTKELLEKIEMALLKNNKINDIGEILIEDKVKVKLSRDYSNMYIVYSYNE
ncbi:WG containing repeat-containing protein [Tenacibaculum sp. MAR_2009_124]|nr:WG containing repeat-containing protein [Tenacibaculum sp. MAR_2009_124]